MPLSKTIVCLAFSRKQAGRCIAGKEIAPPYNGLRPVGAVYPGELTLADVQYRGGLQPGLLDVIEVPVLWPQPEDFQTENIVIDKKMQWTKRGSMDLVHVSSLLDPPDPLWTTGHSTHLGRNDRVLSDYAVKFNYSLRLIRPENAFLTIRPEGADAKPRIRIQFDHVGASYTLSVTDYEAEGAAFRQLGASLQCDIPLPQVFLTISLGKPFRDGFCYDLALASFPRYDAYICAPRPFHHRPLQPHAGALPSLLSIHNVTVICDVPSTP